MSNYRFIVSFKILSIAVLRIDRKMIAVCVRVTVLLLCAVRDVVATLFDERGRAVSSSFHAVLRGRLVDLERMRKLEIQDV